MDYNIDNYSIDELFQLINIDPANAEENEIMEKTNDLIQRFSQTNDANLVTFFQQMQNKLSEFVQDEDDDENQDDDDDDENENIVEKDDQADEWLENQFLPQPNKIQQEKITDRDQQVGFFEENNNIVMGRNRLGIQETTNIPVAQGSLNPNLKNVITRIVSLDSQFRENIFPFTNNPNGVSSSSNYTCLLNDPLTNTIGLELYSVEIPNSWYLIDQYNSNNFFVIQMAGEGDNLLEYEIIIKDGNYNEANLIEEINNKIQETAKELDIELNLVFTYDPLSGKTTMQNNMNQDLTIIFYSPFNFASSMKNCENKIKVNYNLGWIIGYRGNNQTTENNSMFYILTPNQVQESESMVDVYGPRYFLIMLDDFNQNHINKGLVSISLLNSNKSLPNYYSADLNSECVDGQEIFTQNGPRRLTQAQLYSMNQIINDVNTHTQNRTYAATTTDVFAILPLKKGNLTSGAPYVEFGGSLQKNKRTYFGPVNIQNFKVRLVDDKGYTVNLHGMDWSFSIISENLYQY